MNKKDRRNLVQELIYPLAHSIT